jgi:hypothetical protein
MSDNKIREMIKQEIEAAATEKKLETLAKSDPTKPPPNKFILMKDIMEYAMRYRQAVRHNKVTALTRQNYITWSIDKFKLLAGCDLTREEKMFVKKGLKSLENVKR